MGMGCPSVIWREAHGREGPRERTERIEPGVLVACVGETRDGTAERECGAVCGARRSGGVPCRAGAVAWCGARRGGAVGCVVSCGVRCGDPIGSRIGRGSRACLVVHGCGGEI